MSSVETYFHKTTMMANAHCDRSNGNSAFHSFDVRDFGCNRVIYWLFCYSTLLFYNWCWSIEQGRATFSKMTQILVHADNSIVTDRSLRGTREAFQELGKRVKQAGLWRKKWQKFWFKDVYRSTTNGSMTLVVNFFEAVIIELGWGRICEDLYMRLKRRVN